MKASSRAFLSIVLATGAMMILHEPAAAQWSMLDTLHGTACTVAGSSGAGLEFSRTGIKNTGSVPMTVICPVMRTAEVPPLGYRIYANGQHLMNDATSNCRLYSQHSAGTPLADKAMTGASDGRRVTALLYPVDAPTGSSQVVECTLPPGGEVFSLEFFQ